MMGPSSGDGLKSGPDSNERTPLLPKHRGQGIADAVTDHDNVVEAVAEFTALNLGQDMVHASPSAKISDFMGNMSRTRFWLMFSGILLQYFVAMFDSTLMASAHPVITSYFNSSNAASWLSTAFMLTSTSFNPLFGRASDTFGRRPLYLFALTMFAVTTTWCALAQSIGSFIAARAFCGLGAGGVMAMGAIMTNDLVRIEVRGTYQAYINLFFGLGSSCGAAFGGFLCDRIGWRWTFGIQVPPVLAILICAIFTTPSELGPNLAKNNNMSWRKILRIFDLFGSVLLSNAAAFLILALNLGGNILPWKHPLVIASFIISFIAALALLWVEARAYRPILPLAMLFTTPRSNLVFSNFFFQLGTYSVLFNAPLYFQAVKLDSPSLSGFRLAIPAFLLMICGVSCGFFMTRTGRMKTPQVAGSISGLIGAICLSTMWKGIPTWLATIFVIPPSAGQGLMFPATTLAVLATSTQEDQAVMTTTLVLWRQLGIVMGVAVSSLFVQNALIIFLEQYVTGPEKAKIILRVRKSVRAIQDLSPKYQREAMAAYAEALRIAFIGAVVFYIVSSALVLPVKLPNLRKQIVATNTETDEASAEQQNGHSG